MLHAGGGEYRVDYEPAESSTGLFGGNSNWRGPIWFPVNYLLIESLQKFHHYLGDDFKVECPTGSGQYMNAVGSGRGILTAADSNLPARMRTARGQCTAADQRYQNDPHWRDLVLFYEYFHGDNGSGRRRQPPDRLDRPGSQAAAAERRIIMNNQDEIRFDQNVCTRSDAARSNWNGWRPMGWAVSLPAPS